MTSLLTALAFVTGIAAGSILVIELQYYFLERGQKWLGLFVPLIPPFLLLWWALWYSGL